MQTRYGGALSEKHSAQPLGVALLGAGEHARRNLLPALAATPSVRLVGLHARRAEVRDEAARRFGCRAYADAESVLKDAEVEVVVIALPNGLHGMWAERALSAGKHVWCEKPLAPRLADVLGLLETARRRNLGLVECFMFTSHPQFARVRDLLRGGAIGRLHSMTARFGIPHRKPGDIRYDPALAGGALLDVGSYPLKLAGLVLPGPPATVNATIGRQDDHAVDTGGSALVTDEGGVCALLDWGFGRFYSNEAEFWGSEGVLRVERPFSKPPDLATRLTLISRDGPIEEVVPGHDHFAAMFEDLAASVADGDRRSALWKEAEDQARVLSRVRQAALA